MEEFAEKILSASCSVLYQRGANRERDNAAVYSSAEPGTVVKVITRNPEMDTGVFRESVTREYKIQEALAALDVAPSVGRLKISDNCANLQMEKVETVGWDEFITSSLIQEDIFRCVVVACANGFIHNDLHVGNIGKTLEGKCLLIDFGFTKKVDEITSIDVLARGCFTTVCPC